MTNDAGLEIYCFKCRVKTASEEIQEVVLKNGRNAKTGKCKDCGTKKFLMVAMKR